MDCNGLAEDGLTCLRVFDILSATKIRKLNEAFLAPGRRLAGRRKPDLGATNDTSHS